jgi:hypothetical protein
MPMILINPSATVAQGFLINVLIYCDEAARKKAYTTARPHEGVPPVELSLNQPISGLVGYTGS